MHSDFKHREAQFSFPWRLKLHNFSADLRRWEDAAEPSAKASESEALQNHTRSRWAIIAASEIPSEGREGLSLKQHLPNSPPLLFSHCYLSSPWVPNLDWVVSCPGAPAVLRCPSAQREPAQKSPCWAQHPAPSGTPSSSSLSTVSDAAHPTAYTLVFLHQNPLLKEATTKIFGGTDLGVTFSCIRIYMCYGHK